MINVKHALIGLWAMVLVSAVSAQAAELSAEKFAGKKIQWLGQAAFKISDTVTVFTDPFKLKANDKADLILITHSHHDHFSPEDIQKIQVKGTVIVAPEDAALRQKLTGDVRFVKPWDQLQIKGITIQAVPAYNIEKKFHPKDNNWVGYVFEIGKIKIYLAGDTDRIPEMKEIKTDLALLPIGGTYTMTAAEAAEAALDINPKIVIPMHYGAVVGSRKDAEEFRRLLKGKVAVMIMDVK